MAKANRVRSTPPLNSSYTNKGIIYLVPSKPDGNSITQWAVIFACCHAAAEACEPGGPLVERYLELADRALRQLTVLIDRCTRLSRIELTMLERAADRILRPVEDTGLRGRCGGGAVLDG
jgi:hypothetical protein